MKTWIFTFISSKRRTKCLSAFYKQKKAHRGGNRISIHQKKRIFLWKEVSAVKNNLISLYFSLLNGECKLISALRIKEISFEQTAKNHVLVKKECWKRWPKEVKEVSKIKKTEYCHISFFVKVHIGIFFQNWGVKGGAVRLIRWEGKEKLSAYLKSNVKNEENWILIFLNYIPPFWKVLSALSPFRNKDSYFKRSKFNIMEGKNCWGVSVS